jgi:hypothetical protein
LDCSNQVDALLVKYKGREDELLGKLRAKYEIKQFTSPSAPAPPSPVEDAPTLRNQKVSTMGGWGPFRSPAAAPPAPDTFHSSDDESEEEEEEAYTGPKLSREEMLDRARRQARENMDRRIQARVGTGDKVGQY